MRKIKKMLMPLLTLIAIALLMFFVWKEHRVYAYSQNLLLKYTQEVVPGIICIGDSLTGYGDENSWPSTLQKELQKEKIYIPVYNMGVGGENTVTIAGRMGAIPFELEAFVIPKDSTPVEVHFISRENKLIQPMRQGDNGINPCYIGGVRGRLSIEQLDFTSSEYKYFFQREEDGEEVIVPSGSQVTTFASAEYVDGIYIVFMGENHGYDDVEDLISQQKAILNMQEKNHDKYIIIGITSGTAAEREELEKAMFETYGDKYLNLRAYMSTQAIYDAKITPTDADLEQMTMGRIPESLRVDGVHFTDEGYHLIGKQVYAKLVELGYLDSIFDAINMY